MFSDEDVSESILNENEKNGIDDALKSIDSSKTNCLSSLDILQDHILGDVINDSNDVMDISIHGDFSNHQNENFKISGPDILTSLLEPELVLALSYKETKEVQTSFPVRHVTEVSIQVNMG